VGEKKSEFGGLRRNRCRGTKCDCQPPRLKGPVEKKKFSSTRGKKKTKLNTKRSPARKTLIARQANDLQVQKVAGGRLASREKNTSRWKTNPAGGLERGQGKEDD